MKFKRVETWQGMRVYYRRTLRSGVVLLYFTGPGGGKHGHLAVENKKRADLFKPGKTYTIESVSYRPKRIGLARSGRRQ